MLGDHSLQPARAAFREQPVALLERLGAQEAADRRALDQMPQTALAVLEMDRTQVVAVQLHEVESPQHQVIFDALVHLSVQLLEPFRVHEFGV